MHGGDPASPSVFRDLFSSSATCGLFRDWFTSGATCGPHGSWILGGRVRRRFSSAACGGVAFANGWACVAILIVKGWWGGARWYSLPALWAQVIAAFWKIWQLRLTRKDVNTLLCIQGTNPKQTADRFTACFKKLALTSQLPCSLNYLSTRCLSNGWPGSPSYRFLTQLAQIPEQHIAPVPRYTILRWAIGEDNDYWFQFRGTNISRKNPCCGCGATGKNYPISPKAGCFCNNCFPPTREASTYYVTLQDKEAFEQLYHTTLPEDHQVMHEATQVAAQIHNPEHQEVAPCVLCGRGHNGIDHWLKFCPIPSMTFNSLLKQKNFDRH